MTHNTIKHHTGLKLVATFVIFSVFTGLANAKDNETETLDPAMVAQLKKEKAFRKACKIKMCSAMRNKISTGEDISCPIIKTLTKADMNKMVARSKMSWPWDKIYCEFQLNLKRNELATALADGKHEIKMGDHNIKCDMYRGNSKPPYKFDISIAPEIQFENGKAVDAKVAWGKIVAPVLAKAAIWPMTKLDNKMNFVKKEMVATVNSFITKKCDQVKDELTTK